MEKEVEKMRNSVIYVLGILLIFLLQPVRADELKMTDNEYLKLLDKLELIKLGEKGSRAKLENPSVMRFSKTRQLEGFYIGLYPVTDGSFFKNNVKNSKATLKMYESIRHLQYKSGMPTLLIFGVEAKYCPPCQQQLDYIQENYGTSFQVIEQQISVL